MTDFRNTSPLIFVALWLGLHCQVLEAQQLTYRFSGWLPPGSSSHSQVADGETFVGTFVIDRSVADSDPDPTQGIYPGCIVSGSLRFSGGYTSPLDFTSLSDVVVRNAYATAHSFDLDSIAIRRPDFEISAVQMDGSFRLVSDYLPVAGDLFFSSLIPGTFITPQLSYSDSNGSISFTDYQGEPNITFFAHGGDNSWIDTGGGFFEVGSNWADGTVPGTGESASFDTVGLYSVDWDGITGNRQTRNFTVVESAVTFKSVGSGLGDPTYQYSTTRDAIIFNSLLDIGDDIDQHQLNIGSNLWLDGSTVYVRDGSHLEATSGIRIGMTPSVSSAFYVLGGSADTHFLSVGGLGNGFCGSADGAIVNCGGLDVGVYYGFDNSAGSGNFGITDPGTIWTVSSHTTVGDRGQGVITVSNGAILNGDRALLGWSPGSGSATIRNPGSQWNLDTSLDVGVLGFGSLTIEDGAEVNCQDCEVGQLFGAVSEIVVSDALLSANGDLDVGLRGPAELRVNDDAQVLTGTLTNHPDGNIFAGGVTGCFISATNSFTNEGLIHLTCPEPDINASVFNTGTIISSSNAETWFLGIVWHYGSEIRTESTAYTRLFDTFIGSGPFTDVGPVQFDGAIAPEPADASDRGATVTFEGDVIFTSTTVLAFELYGSNLDEFDRLEIDGNLIIDGTLLIDPIFPYFPAAGDEFLIIEVGGTQTGQFIGLNEGDFLGTFNGVGLSITYMAQDGNDIALIAHPPTPVLPELLDITRGDHAGGGITELSTSDNSDVSIRPKNTDIESVTQFEIRSTSPLSAPSYMAVTLEGAVFARSEVDQSIELYDFDSNVWTTVDYQLAQRLSDQSINVVIPGNAARFVQTGTQLMRARITYKSPIARQAFSSFTDLFMWEVSP